MEIAASTLREVEFREKLRGYNPDEVDEFLERVAVGIEALEERLRAATERALRAEQRLAELPEDDGELRRTLVLAQRAADLAVKEANDQAAAIVARAEARARAMIEQAEQVARRRGEEAEAQLRVEVERLRAARDDLLADVGALEEHLARARERAREAVAEAARFIDERLGVPSGRPRLRREPEQAREGSEARDSEAQVGPSGAEAASPRAARAQSGAERGESVEQPTASPSGRRSRAEDQTSRLSEPVGPCGPGTEGESADPDEARRRAPESSSRPSVFDAEALEDDPLDARVPVRGRRP
jgi:DivIVA domain-containing protein